MGDDASLAAWVAVPSLLGLAVLAWLHLRLRAEVRALADAVEARKPYLVEPGATVPGRRTLGRLERGFRELLLENQRRAQSARDSFEQVGAMMRNLQEGVLMVDADNLVVLANEAVREFADRGRVGPGQRVELAFPSGVFLESVRSVKRGEAVVRKEVELVREGAESRWVEVTGTAVAAPSGDGRPLALFVLHDITRLKRLERLRRDFVANVSHELRTPVTIIKGFADTLVDDHRRLGEADRERFLGKIQRNTVRLHELLEDLLTLSRLESGPETIRREPVDLAELVREVAENFRGRPDTANWSIEVDVPDVPAQASGDRIRLTQVLENLLENALRHARGGRRIVLAVRARDGGWRVTVADDGVGIPASDLPHVFERFYRVDKGRSRESGGTGLGLSIVKHIVLGHGGRVIAESQPGQGTSVHVDLPGIALPAPSVS